MYSATWLSTWIQCQKQHVSNMVRFKTPQLTRGHLFDSRGGTGCEENHQRIPSPSRMWSQPHQSFLRVYTSICSKCYVNMSFTINNLYHIVSIVIISLQYKQNVLTLSVFRHGFLWFSGCVVSFCHTAKFTSGNAAVSPMALHFSVCIDLHLYICCCYYVV